ncbi:MULTISPECIES: hypothetical protein [unclassified Bradyrhizobium]|uniref:hypothetical protein n=1 Tax=unclassified Bradyrhizobium TaxID=2631580 RepID=UPI000686B884|nr:MULTISPECIES: hypothetical protein [unclassified Bradyrhizobium]
MEWQRALESPTAFLAEQARAADLVVFKRRKIQSDYFHYLDSDEAILRMGPTLSVPEGVTKLSADRVVVGWKDTREARRAVRDALPFLIRASKVTIAEICASDEQDVAARAMSRATLNGTASIASSRFASTPRSQTQSTSSGWRGPKAPILSLRVAMRTVNWVNGCSVA